LLLLVVVLVLGAFVVVPAVVLSAVPSAADHMASTVACSSCPCVIERQGAVVSLSH
jgi:hypothetical protein